METAPYLPPAPNPARGEVTVLVAGQPQRLRFNLRTLRDYTTTTGTKLTDLGQALAEDTFGTYGNLVASAMRCATGQPFTTEQALDLLDDLTDQESEAVGAAIVLAVRVDDNPLFKALLPKKPQVEAVPTPTSGDSTSTSPSAN